MGDWLWCESALKAVNACFANEKTSDFGPLKLQTVRQTLIDRDLSRTYINGLIAVIVAMFRWAVAQEMVDVKIHAKFCRAGTERQVGRLANHRCE